METMTNRKIAEWLGWKWIKPKSKQMPFDPYWQYPDGMYVPAGQSDFSKDAVAINLLPALVKKGFTENSFHSRMQEDDKTTLYCFQIHEAGIDGEWKPTIAAGISAAIILLIDSEATT
jgi:hypothetical protein